MSKTISFCLTLALLCLNLGANSDRDAEIPVSYTITPIGVESAGTPCSVYGFNNHGDIAGSIDSPGLAGGSCACMWRAGHYNEPVLIGSILGAAHAINDRGVVTGYTTVNRDTKYESFAFTWQNGKLTSLASNATGRAINASGDVAGIINRRGDTYAPHVVFWHDGKTTEIGTLGGSQNDVFAMNSHGDMVGWSYAKAVEGEENMCAYLWHDGKLNDLGVCNEQGGVAVGINDRCEIILSHVPANGTPHFYLWKDNHLTELPPVNGMKSEPISINNQGDILGSSFNTHDAHF